MKAHLSSVNLLISMSMLLAGLSACSDDGLRGARAPLLGPPEPRVTHPAGAPFANARGDIALVGDTKLVGATLSGLLETSLRDPTRTREWSLTSTGAGPAVVGLAVSVRSGEGDGRVVFLPTGRPDVGVLDLGSGGEGSLIESVLVEPLATPYPSAIDAPVEGPGSDAVFVVDAVFGPGGSVRVYPHDAFAAPAWKLSEARARRFTPELGDVDGDGTHEIPVLGRLTFADHGRVGLVSFSFAAPAPEGVAGGVLAFDSATGQPLGRVILPKTSSLATTLEYVGSVRATEDRLVLVSSEKNADSFADVGGVVAVYAIESWSPLRVTGAADERYDSPLAVLRTSAPNPVGLVVRGGAALVVDAPFVGEGALDLFDLREIPSLSASVPLGRLYASVSSIPGDPKLLPDGSAVLVGTEVGTLKVELVDR